MNDEESVSFKVETDESFAKINNEKLSLNNMIYIIDKMSEVIIDNEVPFCELDSQAGDGDFGMSIAKGFKQLKREWKDILAEKHSKYWRVFKCMFFGNNGILRWSIRSNMGICI